MKSRAVCLKQHGNAAETALALPSQAQEHSAKCMRQIPGCEETGGDLDPAKTQRKDLGKLSFYPPTTIILLFVPFQMPFHT